MQLVPEDNIRIVRVYSIKKFRKNITIGKKDLWKRLEAVAVTSLWANPFEQLRRRSPYVLRKILAKLCSELFVRNSFTRQDRHLLQGRLCGTHSGQYRLVTQNRDEDVIGDRLGTEVTFLQSPKYSVSFQKTNMFKEPRKYFFFYRGQTSDLSYWEF